MKRNLYTFILIFVFFCHFLSSCKGATTDRVSFVGEESFPFPATSLSFAESYKTDSVSFPNVSSIADVIKTDTGFLLLSYIPDRDSTAFLWLDSSLEITKSEERPGTFVSACLYDSSYYFLEKKDLTYTLYRERDVVTEWDNITSQRHILFPSPLGLYVMFDSALYFNTKQVSLPQAEFGFFYSNISMLSSFGNIYLSTQMLPDVPESTDPKLFFFPLEQNAVGTPIELSEELLGSFCFSGNDNALLYLTSNALMSYSGNGHQEIVSLSVQGIPSGIVSRILILPNMEFLLVGTDELYLLSPSTNTATDTIQIGSLWAYHTAVNDEILSYNKQSLGPVAEITQYDNPSESNKLNLALLSNDLDLLLYDVQNFPYVRNLFLSGALVPITDYIDPEVFLPNLISPGKMNGEWFTIPIMMGLEGFSLPSDVMGSRSSFSNIAEFTTIINSLSDQRFRKSLAQEEALTYAGMYGSRGFEDWVDWNTYTCNFEEESFTDLLTLMKSYAPDRDQAEANSTGRNRPLLTKVSFTTLDTFNLRLMYEEKGTEKPYSEYDMEGAAFSIPGNGKYSGLSITSNCMIAIPANADKEAVMTFLSHLLSKETQLRMMENANAEAGIPVRNDTLDTFLDQQSHLTNEQKATVSRLITTADAFAIGPASDISMVVREEASRYFAGEISVEQAAAYIQNRISLYLAEQS